MPDKEYLQKEIDNLRDKRSQMFNLFFALISGSVAMIVYVLMGEKPAVGLGIAGVGFVVSMFAYWNIHKLNRSVDQTLQALKDAE